MHTEPPARRSRAAVAILLGLTAAAAAAALTACANPISAIKSYEDPYHAKVADAGYVAKTVKVNGVTLSYVEGPDNGPPLVLLHAQLLDWFSYSRVLPSLARSFHVYDIDYPGHGSTVTPKDYPMTANRIGADLGDFIAQHIGKPVYISGNSSGGLLAVWLAAHRPQLIKAALLEDPPLFSSEYPRIKQTIADKAFKTSYTALTDKPDDFLLYWIHENAPFFRKQVGPGTPFMLTEAIKVVRKAKPGQPPEVGLIKNDTVRMMVRGLDQYDPRFGAAFYDGTWNAGFDHAAALAQITAPVLLMQAETSTDKDGMLMGAMSEAEAKRATALLQHGTYVKVDATHVVNLDKPAMFVATLQRFFLQQ